MRTITRRMTIILILLILALDACTWSPPESEATVDVDAIVAETMQAVATYAQATVLAHEATVAAPEEQAVTAAPAEPSETPAPPTMAAPPNPIISVSVDTNCRTGPGQIYDYVGALLVGEEAEVTAREATGRFWYIRNPDGIADFCWVWDEYATILGDTSSLPVLAPPPTPTPVPGSISGIVYLDDNHNGQLDPTDGWISGSILELIPGGCAGAVAATTESSSVDGSYSFTGLAPGSYCVRPSPLQQTMNPLTRTVIVDPGEDVTGVLFRYVP